jgi:hypothetical protein
VKGEDAARPQLFREPPQEPSWLRLELQHVSTDDRVERRRHSVGDRIALFEGHIRVRAGRGPLTRDRYRPRRPIHPDDGPARPDDLGDKEGDVAATGADIEYPHARANAGIEEQLARDRLDQCRLKCQPPQLGLGMTEYIPGPGFDAIWRLRPINHAR